MKERGRKAKTIFRNKRTRPKLGCKMSETKTARQEKMDNKQKQKRKKNSNLARDVSKHMNH